MKWVTRENVGVDRIACAWLINRYVDSGAEFVFASPDRVSLVTDAEPFDVPGVRFSHHKSFSTFHTMVREYDLTDPVLWRIAAIVHEADLDDERYDAPEAPGFDVALRGLSMICDDTQILAITGPVFDGLYEYHRRATLLGREPAASQHLLKGYARVDGWGQRCCGR